jgi:hypothetical protein
MAEREDACISWGSWSDRHTTNIMLPSGPELVKVHEGGRVMNVPLPWWERKR